MESVIIVHGLLIVVIAALEKTRNHGLRFDYMTLLSVVYAALYGITPIAYQLFGRELLVARVGPPPREFLLQSALFILLGYGFLYAGYVLSRRLTRRRLRSVLETERARRAAVCCGVLGVIFFFVYVNIYGGITSALAHAALIRSGHTADSGWVLVSHFHGMVALGLWAVTPLRVFGNRQWLRRFVLIAFVLFAVLSVLITAGRNRALMYFVPVILVFATKGRVKAPVLTSALAVSGIFMWLSWGDYIFQILAGFSGVRANPGGNFLFSLLDNFTPSYFSVPWSLQHYYQGGDLLWIGDWWDALVAVLPSKLTGIETSIYTATNLNTALVSGVTDRINPPGMIAWAIYSLGPFFLLWPFLFGFGTGFIESRYRPVGSRSRFGFCMYTGVGLVLAYNLNMITDPSVWVRAYIWIWMPVLTIELLARLPKLRRRPVSTRSIHDIRTPESY